MWLRELRSLNLELLLTLKGFVEIIRDPNHTDSIFDIIEGMRHTKASKRAVEYMKSKPGVSSIVESRYLAPTPDLNQLLKCPQDSLGYEYASRLKAEDLEPKFYRDIKVEDDLSYILLRIRQSHDIWHTVTDFGTDVVGELGLQSFNLAQTHLPLPVILIAGGLLKTIVEYPENLDKLLDRIAVGYRMGSKAKPFLAQKWEENWDKPLSQWRSELGVEPSPVYIP